MCCTAALNVVHTPACDYIVLTDWYQLWGVEKDAGAADLNLYIYIKRIYPPTTHKSSRWWPPSPSLKKNDILSTLYHLLNKWKKRPKNRRRLFYLMSHSETQWVPPVNFYAVEIKAKSDIQGKYTQGNTHSWALESQLMFRLSGDPVSIYVWDQAANEWGYSPTWLPLAACVWNMMQVNKASFKIPKHQGLHLFCPTGGYACVCVCVSAFKITIN